MVSDPTVTVLATEEPEIMPNSAEPKIDTFAGPPAKRPATQGCTVEEQLAKADARGENAEQHEMEDIGCDDAERDAVNALCGQIKMIDQLADRGAGMNKNTRHGRSVKCVKHEQDRDDRQGPTHRSARRFQKNEDQEAPEHHIGGRRIADAESQIVKRDQWHMENSHDRDNRQRPVDDRYAERPQQRGNRRFVITRAGERKDEKHEAEHEREMDAAVHHFRQDTEAGRVVMKKRQDDQKAANDAGRERSQRAETNFGIELLFQFARLDLVQFHRREFYVLVLRHVGSTPCRPF